MFSDAPNAALPKRQSRWPWRGIVAGCVLAIGLIWLGAWLLDCRHKLRLRLQIKQLNGRVETTGIGPQWLAWLVDPRYFERVVAIHLTHTYKDDWIRAFEELETLNVFGIPLGEKNLAQISSLQNLRTLGLIKVETKGPELRYLVEIPDLEDLRLSDLTHDAARYLEGCDQLRVLQIIGSRGFTDDSLRELPTFPRLERLELILTSVTKDGARRWGEQHPAVEVVHHNDGLMAPDL